MAGAWATSNQTSTLFGRSDQSSDYSGSQDGDLAFNLQNNAAVAAAPEPSDWAGMGMASFALCGLIIRARRKDSTSKKATATAASSASKPDKSAS